MSHNSDRSRGQTVRALVPPSLVRPLLGLILVVLPGLLVLFLGIRLGLVVMGVILLAGLGPLLAMAGMNRDEEEFTSGGALSWARNWRARDEQPPRRQ